MDFLTHGNAQDSFAIILVLGETMPRLESWRDASVFVRFYEL